MGQAKKINKVPHAARRTPIQFVLRDCATSNQGARLCFRGAAVRRVAYSTDNSDRDEASLAKDKGFMPLSTFCSWWLRSMGVMALILLYDEMLWVSHN